MITSVIAFTSKDAEWLLYDKYDIFSSRMSSQQRLAIIALLIAVPSALYSYVESVVYLTHVQPGSYFLVKLVSGADTLTSNIIIGGLVGFFLVTTNIIFHLVRYQPLLNIIYSANSVRAHLAIVNSQMISTSKQFVVFRGSEGSTLADNADHLALTSIMAQEDPIWSSLMGANSAKVVSQQSTKASARSLRDELLATGRNESSAGYATCSPISSGHLSFRGLTLEDSMFRQEEIPAKVRLTSVSNATISRLALSNVVNPDGRQAVRTELGTGAHFAKRREPICVIRNLHQLELHITRLSLFVGDMDRCAAEVVCALCFLVFIQFIYTVFFMVEMAKNFRSFSTAIFAFICVLIQMAMPLCLFNSGDRMQKEAKKLLANLELIYLEDSSQRLVYKQHGSDTMASLARIIKLLKTIRFNCDKTMNIDLATLKRFILYLVTTIFIVVQYGRSRAQHE